MEPFDVFGSHFIAGVDEAGRGPLAGPVVAAAVILDPAWPIMGLADSKKLSPARRDALADQIRARAMAFGIGRASVTEIDEINILRASHLAMQRAVDNLAITPTMVLVDGNLLPPLCMPAVAVIKGDDRIPAISAGSILAKTVRDQDMRTLDKQFPQYGFARHKGYATRYHLAALLEHGPACVHRVSFAPVREAQSQARQMPLPIAIALQ